LNAISSGRAAYQAWTSALMSAAASTGAPVGADSPPQAASTEAQASSASSRRERREDLYDAQARLAFAQAQQLDLESQLALSREELRAITGVSVGELFRLDPALAIPAVQGSVESWLEQARTGNQQIRAREFAVDAADKMVAQRQGAYIVMVYTSDDPLIAKRLEELGCVAVMPLGAPIGSGLGIRNPYNIRMILENATVPIIVDAGVGTASDAAIAMELGCHGVLMNTAIAEARNPVLMASAMKKAVESGREAFLAGRMPRRLYASASSPIDGTFF